MHSDANRDGKGPEHSRAPRCLFEKVRCRLSGVQANGWIRLLHGPVLVSHPMQEGPQERARRDDGDDAGEEKEEGGGGGCKEF